MPAQASAKGKVPTDLRKELIKGIIHIARHKEFYGHVVQQFQKVYVRNPHCVPTACVGRFPGEKFIKLWLNLDYFASLYEEHGLAARDYLLGAEEHEILHICSSHLTLHFDDRVRGNVAVDLAVNSHLLENQIAPNWPVAENYGFPKGKAAVWYYNNLKGNSKFQQQLKSGAFGVGGIMEWLGKSHAGWEELEKDPVAKEFVKDIMRKAKELCNKSYGNIPSDIIEMIEELLKREKPVIPWGHVLRMFCASATESVLEYTMRRESKRYGTRPGTRKGDVLNLAVCVDTSGCFVGETLIPMADGSLKRIDSVKEGNLVVSSAFGKDQVVRKCVKVWEFITKDLVEVEMGKGFSFNCTPNHKVFVVRPAFDIRQRLHVAPKGRRGKYLEMVKESQVVEMRADELKEGDLLVATNGTLSMPLPERQILSPLSVSQSGAYITQKDLDLADELKSQGMSYRRQHREGKMRFDYRAILGAKNHGLAKNLVSIPKQTSEEFCQLMGYFTGDGNADIATFIMTDESKARLEIYQQLVKRIFGLDGEIKQWTRQRLVVNSKSLVAWVKSNFPTIVARSKNRTLPEAWTGLPDNEVGALLRGLFDAEGFVGEHYVALSNSSRELIRQMHLLLARLGVEASVRPTNIKDRLLRGRIIKGGHFWRLAVGGLVNLRRFEKIVGFSCPEKREKLRKVVAAISKEQNNDSFPYTERQRLVEVKSVTKKHLDSYVKVYDLEIEGEHNYLPNGIVAHNSISNEQLKLFFNEIRWIWKNGAIVSVVEADAAVARGPYKFNGKWNGEVHGRGGTDLEPALALVEGKYDACIYFTDFYAPRVSRVYRIPTLWVLTTELPRDEYPAQWGRHIKIEDGHAVAG